MRNLYPKRNEKKRKERREEALLRSGPSQYPKRKGKETRLFSFLLIAAHTKTNSFAFEALFYVKGKKLLKPTRDTPTSKAYSMRVSFVKEGTLRRVRIKDTSSGLSLQGKRGVIFSFVCAARAYPFLVSLLLLPIGHSNKRYKI